MLINITGASNTIEVEHSTNCLIENCTFVHCGWDGLELADVVSVRVVRNEFRSCAASAIYVDNGTDVVIKFNTITGSGHYGIRIASGSNIIVHHNRIEGCGYTFMSCGFYCAGTEVIIYANDFINNYETEDSQACDDGIGNLWYNATAKIGNHWSDHTEPDEDGEGIVDTPYPIAGSAGSEDKYPLVNPVVTGPAIYSIDWEPRQPGPGEPVTVTAVIMDPDGVAKAELWYKNDTKWYVVPMSYVGDDTYEAIIPGQPANTTVHFKIWAVDKLGFESVSSELVYTVSAAPMDTEPPTITDVSWMPEEPEPDQPVVVKAKVMDNVALHTVLLKYRVSGTTTWSLTGMTPIGGDYYQATIPGQPAGTTVEFCIWANDTSGNTAEACYSYTVKTPAPPDTEGLSISDVSWSPKEPEEGETVTVEAKVTDPSGVAEVVLSYSTDGGKTWTNKTMSSVGADRYRTTIPGQKAGTTVSFKIYARDNADNWSTPSTFTYMVKAKAAGAPPPARMSMIWVISGVAVAVVVAAVAAYLLKLRK